MTMIVDKNSKWNEEYKEVVKKVKSYTKNELDFAHSILAGDRPELFFTEVGFEAQIEGFTNSIGWIYYLDINIETSTSVILKVAVHAKEVEDD